MIPYKFGRISEIDPSNAKSWADRYFITFDVDWACDAVIADTVKLVESSDIAATWFITHDSPWVERLRQNPRFELGIHPNFNFLLQGNPCNGASSKDVVERLLRIVPEARAVRSHSMTQSSRLLDLFKEAGLSHDCNHFIPYHVDLELKPWLHWNGIIKVPYFWEDDVDCLESGNRRFNEILKCKGLCVFDFHPIHVFLNTESMKRYEKTSSIREKPSELILRRHTGYGTRNQLIDLLSLANKQ